MMTKSNTIKVLHLAAPGKLYGAERWVLALIKHLDRAKVFSIVSAIKDSSELTLAICENATSLGFLASVFEANGKLSLGAIPKIRKFILENKIDVLHTHWYKPDIIGLLSVIGTNCRIVSTPHGWSQNADIKLRFYEAISRFVFPFFNAVAPLSNEIYLELDRIPGIKHRLHLIENGVDLEEIDATTEINSELASWKNEGMFVLGYIGQLIPRKGLDVLLKAFATLDHRCLRLAIVGSGEQGDELRSFVKVRGLSEYVKFFGFREDRLSFLKGFDAFILPSRREGTPRCVMEAMAAGIPVVVSGIPGCLNLVTHNVNGLVFKADDYESLADRINNLVLNESLRAELGKEGPYYIREKFSAERMANEYLKLYESLCSVSSYGDKPGVRLGIESADIESID